jgi:hypothetical protein
MGFWGAIWEVEIAYKWLKQGKGGVIGQSWEKYGKVYFFVKSKKKWGK